MASRDIPRPIVFRRAAPAAEVVTLLQRPEKLRHGAPQRQPVFNIPWPVAATLAALLAIQAVREVLPDGWDDALFLHLAFVPGRFTYALAPDRVVEALAALAARGGSAFRQAQAERWLLLNTGLDPWTAASYAVLHADWAHVGLNSVWLLAFGTPVARRFRAARFFAFMLAGAVAGAVAQWCCQPTDLAPVIGASAAVSGCMGATLRFMFQPHVPLTALVEAAEEGRRPAYLMPVQALRDLARDGRALTFLVAWFATNLLFGLAPLSLGFGGGPIAWQAHIGGFAVGLLLFRVFDPVRPAEPADLAPSAPVDPAPGAL